MPGALWPPRFPSALWYPAQIQNHCWFFSSKDICQTYPPPLFKYFCNFFLYTLLEHRHIRNTLVPSDLLRLFLVYWIWNTFRFSICSLDYLCFIAIIVLIKGWIHCMNFLIFGHWEMIHCSILLKACKKQYVALQILLWTSISDPSTMAPKYGNLLTYINLDHWVIWLLIHIEMYSSSENLCLVLANSQLCRVFDQLKATLNWSLVLDDPPARSRSPLKMKMPLTALEIWWVYQNKKEAPFYFCTCK